jgi:uridine phosphorylase
MSIINTFDDKSEEIIKPSNIAQKIEYFPETVLVTFKQKIIDIAMNLFSTEIIDNMYLGSVVPIYKLEYQSSKIGLYRTIIGGPASVGLLEEIIAKGANKILFFGPCGSLDKNLSAGYLIVPTAAYRDEGTSYHYMPAGDYVEVKTSDRLGSILNELGIPFIYGKTWTTDAFYRETRNNMEARKKEGCITVDMECASVMAAGQFRGVEIFQFLYAADSLYGDSWDPRTLGKVPQSDNERYLRIALEIAERL